MLDPLLPALFTRDGERFVPNEAAAGPWSPNALHGGSVCGLLARSIERSVTDPELFPVRLTVDLFRSVPRVPLEVNARRTRDGRRLCVIDASISRDGVELARASGLFLRRTEAGEPSDAFRVPTIPGPEGLETTGLVPEIRRAGLPPGLHLLIEARWTALADSARKAAWFRLPFDLVQGEVSSPFVRTATVGDFANAVASLSIPRPATAAPTGPTFINADTTLYLSRMPAGEWLGMSADHVVERDGLSLIEVALYDGEGRFGRSLQARIANRLAHGPAPGSDG